MLQFLFRMSIWEPKKPRSDQRAFWERKSQKILEILKKIKKNDGRARGCDVVPGCKCTVTAVSVTVSELLLLVYERFSIFYRASSSSE